MSAPAGAARDGGTDQLDACSAVSLAAGEPLGGTATRADRWLVVERRGAWGADVVADTDLPDAVRTALERVTGRVLFVRRPDRRDGETVVLRAQTDERGGALWRATAPAGEDAARLVDAIDALGGDGQPAAGRVQGTLLLVCSHGRRDACCARLGVPVFDALDGHVDPALLWQSSHHGGHRFAANVLALPAGVQLGRVPPHDAARVAGLLAAGRIPLDRYRGRTLYEPRVQAAEVDVRTRLGLDGVADLELRGDDGQRVTFRHAAGETTVTVVAAPGPPLPLSCGDEPAGTVAYSVRW